ncbi:hypothetical protein TWF730_010142 [Orbilia blumenaviensis]|uniref:Uncharacterized protein n=1 Tax=Orbilia blumenaviensis TaxID=1796055 RepID=A0AAV9UN83_9PEZI
MPYSRQCVFQLFRYGIILSQVVGVEILFDQDILYPLSLLWLHTITTLLVTLLTHLTAKSLCGGPASTLRPTSKSSAKESPWDRVLTIVVGFLDIVIQLCVVQGLFHTRSITLPMLFYYLADVVVHALQLANLRYRPKSLHGFACVLFVPIILIAPFVILIILAERKLNPFALLFLLVGAGGYLVKASINFYWQGQSCVAGQKTSDRSLLWPLWSTLALVLTATSVLLISSLEGLIIISRGGLEKLRAGLHPVFLLPSILLGVLNALEYMGSSSKNSSNPEEFKPTESQADYATSMATMDAVVVFICTFLLFLQTPSWVQVISYGVIVMASTLAVAILCRSIKPSINIPRADTPEGENLELEDYCATRKLLDNEELSTRRTKSRLQGIFYSFTLKLWILFAGLLGTKLLLERPSYSSRIDQITSNGLNDTPYVNATKMDIVISYYKEDLNGVYNFLKEVKEIPQIKKLQPNIIVYTKGDRDNIPEIRSGTAADDVFILPNKGREGATYLRHIIDRYDTIANHTLFVQAEPHSRSQVIGRLKNYFDSSRTGMLDLGHRELRGCKCLDCRDEYSWRDATGLIPDLMAQAHHIKCDEDTHVATSYKGQFIVSAKRIRAVKKSLYETLHDKLVGKNRIIIGNPEEDRIDAPFFGYSLERSWNIIFQCADLTGVRDMCPGLTLLPKTFGDFNKVQPEDCGCMDA